MITQIKKRDGSIALFNKAKISDAIFKAAKSVGGKDRERAEQLASMSVELLEQRGFCEEKTPNVEDVQDAVEKTLIEEGHAQTAKAYIIYREQHKRIREFHSYVNSNEIMDGYLNQLDWRVKENSNMSFSLQGLNNHISSIVSSNYWLHKIYPPEVREAHIEGDIHLHDLQILGSYCCGWDIMDLMIKGFGGVPEKVESMPAKHYRAMLGQITNFFYTLQGETAGAQAFSNFNTMLAPFVKYDHLEYKDVKQGMQEFLFNMNVPTRVGFQCLSADTEILTPTGWKGHEDIKTGETIETFNLRTGIIEPQKVASFFKKEYNGKMYRLQNRIQDQLISPNHRIVRKKFQTKENVLEPIEQILKLKSPFIIPIAGKNTKPEAKIDDRQIKLMAWIISEGTIERPTKYRCCYRVSIYQSKIKNKANYNEIKSLLHYFKLDFSEYETASLGESVSRMRLNAESSKKIHKWFGSRDSVHFIPDSLLNLSERQSRLFLDTYIKGDGFEGCKISVSDIALLDRLQIIAVNAGFGSSILKRKPTIGKKDIFVLRIIRHKGTYISKVSKVDYKGIIWCPHTKNETVVARRRGKVFITGNTPFTNLTLDIEVPENLRNSHAIIGGRPMPEVYGDFQKEAEMVNQAFLEVMSEGDAKGRIFTFPIPTYNITKNIDWKNPAHDTLFEVTSKFGLPYFANFVNSEMSPDDARSMCCRLRLDNRELRKRSGGLFASAPLTGSIGVVTLNMPRIAFAAKDEARFAERVVELMKVSKTSLDIKRKAVERFTEQGLYPYAKRYLAGVKQSTGQYWGNHFNTIGLIGMNEACLNLLGTSIASNSGKKFALNVLDAMREELIKYQERTNDNYNLEATPGEGCSYRFAKMDREKFPEIKTAGEKVPYYTNSTHLPVGYTDDIFEALDLQDELQCKYTGGTVLHGFVGERISDPETCKKLVRKIANNYKLPYFTITPTFSVCPDHGYLAGERQNCEKETAEGVCGRKCEVFSRVVGYYRPVQSWNDGKREEFRNRKPYCEKKSVESMEKKQGFRFTM